MTITQIVEIPDDRRVSIEFLAPQEIPAGKAKVEVKLTPVVDEQTDWMSEGQRLENAEGRARPLSDSLLALLSQPTPRADALAGALKGLGDITLEQIREERLAKHSKHLK